MSIVGGNLESKELGLQIGTSGTHNNTEIDLATGFLRLKQIDSDGSGKPVYAEEGTWISNPINLEDKFNGFDRVFTSDVDNGSSRIAVLTRVSDNGVEWSEWVAVAYDGNIQSQAKQYIQVKIDLFAGYETDVFLILDFNSVNDVSLLDNNNFVDTSNGLRLKREHEFDMTLDTSWVNEGSLHRKLITRDEWVRIDRLNFLKKG